MGWRIYSDATDTIEGRDLVSTSRDGNPLIDGRGSQRRMRESITPLCMRVHPGGSLRGEPIEQASPKTRTGCADEVARGQSENRKLIPAEMATPSRSFTSP